MSQADACLRTGPSVRVDWHLVTDHYSAGSSAAQLSRNISQGVPKTKVAILGLCCSGFVGDIARIILAMSRIWNWCMTASNLPKRNLTSTSNSWDISDVPNCLEINVAWKWAQGTPGLNHQWEVKLHWREAPHVVTIRISRPTMCHLKTPDAAAATGFLRCFSKRSAPIATGAASKKW